MWRYIAYPCTMVKVIDMRYLSIDETDYIKSIANIHEHIPTIYDTGKKVTSLEISLRYESIRLLMHHRGDQIIIIEDNRQLCAFIWFSLNDSLHIKSTYVCKQFRNKGFATQLKVQVERIAKSKNIKQIFCDVDRRNEPMRQLNLKLGYKSINNSTKMIKILEV
ncbi:GNAT family N-acetyltransferase [Macrococcus equi]|uniref:GNAT family N-acetyltransferase n=1 Tax=Macrococcus equi TaxID=3395462 RepID=UPI0039BE41BC